MNNQPIVISERIDDVVLLLNVMMQIGLPELLNRHLPRHWHQKGLDWGWVGVIWLSYVLSSVCNRLRSMCRGDFSARLLPIS